jgi:hypothetical protein
MAEGFVVKEESKEGGEDGEFELGRKDGVEGVPRDGDRR